MRFIFQQLVNGVIVGLHVERHCDSGQMLRLTELYRKGGHQVKVYLGGLPGCARYLGVQVDGVLCHEAI